jgi:hypothetical protein
MLKRLLLLLVIVTGILGAAAPKKTIDPDKSDNGTVVTGWNVTQLYVATFDRAPDAAGLQYWVD